MSLEQLRREIEQREEEGNEEYRRELISEACLAHLFGGEENNLAYYLLDVFRLEFGGEEEKMRGIDGAIKRKLENFLETCEYEFNQSIPTIVNSSSLINEARLMFIGLYHTLGGENSGIEAEIGEVCGDRVLALCDVVDRINRDFR